MAKRYLLAGLIAGCYFFNLTSTKALANQRESERWCPVEWLTEAARAFQETQFIYHVFYNESGSDFLVEGKSEPADFSKIFWSEEGIGLDEDKPPHKEDLIVFFPHDQYWINLRLMPQMDQAQEDLAADARAKPAERETSTGQSFPVKTLPPIQPVQSEKKVPQADILVYLNMLDRIQALEYNYGFVKANLANQIRILDREYFIYQRCHQTGSSYNPDCDPEDSEANYYMSENLYLPNLIFLRSVQEALKSVETRTAKLRQWLKQGNGEQSCKINQPGGRPAVQPQIVYADRQEGGYLTVHFRLANAEGLLSTQLLNAWQLEINNGNGILPEPKDPVAVYELQTGRRIQDPVTANAFVISVPYEVYSRATELDVPDEREKILRYLSTGPGSIRLVPKPNANPGVSIEASDVMDVVWPGLSPEGSALDLIYQG